MNQRVGRLAFALYPYAISLVCLAVLALLGHLGQTLSAWANDREGHIFAAPQLWLVLPASFAAGLVPACFEKPPRRFISGAVALAATTLLGALDTGFLWLAFGIPLVVVILEARRAVQQGSSFNTGLTAAALLNVILAIAVSPRFFVLTFFLRKPLDPDAITFLNLAETHSGFNTGVREPLYLWMIQAMRLVSGGYSPTALRTFSVLLSCATISVIFLFTRRHIGLLGAVTASLLYSFNIPFIYTAIRGLREEIIIASFLLYVWVVLEAWGKRPQWRSYGWLGGAGAVMVGLRLNSGPFVVVSSLAVFAYGAYRHRLAARQWWIGLLPLLITYGSICPFLYYSHKNYGDAFYAVSMHTRWYANYELAGKYPDMPSRKQVEENGYVGPKISMGQYLFKYHTVGEVASRCWGGGWRLYLGDLVHIIEMDFRSLEDAASAVPNVPRRPLLYVVHLLGLAAMLYPRRRLGLFVLTFLFHAPAFFLASFEWFDWRLLTVAFAVFYIGVGAAAETGLSLLRRQLLGTPQPELAFAREVRRPAMAGRKALKRS